MQVLLRLRLPINHDTYVVLLSFQHLVYAFLRCFAGKLFRDSKSEGLAGNGLQPRNIQGVFGNEVVDIHGLLLAHSSAGSTEWTKNPAKRPKASVDGLGPQPPWYGRSCNAGKRGM